MTFEDHVLKKKTALSDFYEEIRNNALAGMPKSTFNRKVGKNKFSPLEKEAIASYLDTTVEILWPEKLLAC